jgi:(p)ppGpp synthase/HD superfamily hydrolase
VITLIARASEHAARLHEDQVDKQGLPYIDHPARVAARVATWGGSDEAIAAAWLHDVVEDTSWTSAGIHAAYGPQVGALVDALTKAPHEPNADYYQRVIAAGPDAILVKMADAGDNADPKRLAGLDPDTAVRLARKYRHCLSVMADAMPGVVAP